MIEPEPKESINPYAVPQSSSVIDAAPSDPNPPPLQLPLVFTKWLFICILAAGPSFYFGGMLGGFRLSAVTGMGIGILIFVIAYTAIEYTSAVQRQMRKPVSRRASWIAYSTRIIISVIFPIGIFVDVFCGMLAVPISSSILGIKEPGMRFDQAGYSDDFRCIYFLVTTMVQGVLLNFVVFAYMGIVWLICKGVMREPTV